MRGPQMVSSAFAEPIERPPKRRDQHLADAILLAAGRVHQAHALWIVRRRWFGHEAPVERSAHERHIRVVRRQVILQGRGIHANLIGLPQAEFELRAAGGLPQIVQAGNALRNLQEVVVDFVDERLARFPGPIEDRAVLRIDRVAQHQDVGALERTPCHQQLQRQIEIDPPGLLQAQQRFRDADDRAGNSAGSAARTRGRVALTSCQDAIPQPRRRRPRPARPPRSRRTSFRRPRRRRVPAPRRRMSA